VSTLADLYCPSSTVARSLTGPACPDKARRLLIQASLFFAADERSHSLINSSNFQSDGSRLLKYACMYRAMIEKWILPLRAFYKCSPLYPNAEGRHQRRCEGTPSRKLYPVRNALSFIFYCDCWLVFFFWERMQLVFDRCYLCWIGCSINPFR